MPTIKQKKAFKETGANGGNIKRAMKTAGYGKTKSDKLTKSKGWQELLKMHLSDEMLAKKHKQLLDKQEVIVKNNVTSGEIDVIPTGEIDVQAVKAGLDMAYKLKGRYIERTDITSGGEPIVFMPSEVIEKFNLNEVSSSSSDNSEGQSSVQSD